MLTGKYWVVDTEGNGANPNEPIELGMVEMEGLEITGRMHLMRFRPFAPITYYATKIHGIKNGDLDNEPTFEDRATEIEDILGNYPVIGHFVKSELDALEPRLPNWKPQAAFDTLPVAKKLIPDNKQHKLSVLAERYDLEPLAVKVTGKKAHNGLYDALVTAMLVQSMAHEFGDGFFKIFPTSDILRNRKLKQEQRIRNKAKHKMREQWKQSQLDLG